MEPMETNSNGRLLRIYISESDRDDGHPLDEAIVDVLRSAGISGATVVRGIAGYGGSAVLHTTHVLRLSEDLPLVIEAVDTADTIAAVLPHLLEMAGDAVITTHPVEIHRPSPTS
jgi:PII-like signaling protein